MFSELLVLLWYMDLPVENKYTKDRPVNCVCVGGGGGDKFDLPSLIVYLSFFSIPQQKSLFDSCLCVCTESGSDFVLVL